MSTRKIDTTSGLAIGRRALITALAGIGCGATLAGCGVGSDPGSGAASGSGSPAGDTGTVTIWHNFLDLPAQQLEDLVEAYNGETGRTAVEIKQFPNSGFSKKVNEAVQNGVGPDIIFKYSDEAADYVVDDVVVDFLQYLDDPKIGIDDYREQVLPEVYEEATGYGDGSMYALPISITGPVLYYNADMYGELGLSEPATWQELADNARAIHDAKGVAGIGFDSVTDVMQMLFFQNGVEYLDFDDLSVGFDSPRGVELAEWFVSYVQEGAFSVAPMSDYWHTDLNMGSVGMFMGSCASEEYLGSDVNWNVCSLPQEGTPWYPLWTRSGIVFASDPDRERACYDFLRYMIQPENNIACRVMKISLSPYSWTTSLDEYAGQVEAWRSLPIVQDNLANAGLIYPVPGTAVIRSSLEEAVLSAIGGDVTVAAALAKAAEESESALVDIG